jgi:hypothetical protein
VISFSHNACDLLPKDVAKQVAKEKEKAQSVPRWVAKERGEDTPIESDSSEEDTLPPLSSPRTTPPPFGDIAGR